MSNPVKIQVLVVARDPVDRKLATALLMQQNHAVVSVDNAAEADFLLERERFDLLLLDAELPGFDALQSRCVRESRPTVAMARLPLAEQGRDEHRGDGQTAFCLSKPLNAQALADSLLRVLHSGRPPSGRPSTKLPSITPDVMDTDTALRWLGGDMKMLVELAELFGKIRNEMVRSIEAALASGDGEALSSAAHRLRGSVSNLAARDTCAAALRLEQLGASGQLDEAQLALRDLHGQLDRLDAALRTLMQQG